MNYKRIYERLVQGKNKRIKLPKNDPNYIYYENHHIIPKSLDGSDSVENLILLTAKEHFIAHKLLLFIYPKSRKMANAIYIMVHGNHNYNESSRDYSLAKELISMIPMSKETREKISKANKGKKKSPLSNEHKYKISLSKLGQKRSVISKEKQRMTLNERGVHNKIDNELREMVKEMTKNKITASEIANELNISTRSVFRIRSY